jgi:Tol biopolymer transport system component
MKLTHFPASLVALMLPAFANDSALAPQLATHAPPASRSASGSSNSPRISRDGQTVVFVSDAPNLVPGDLNGFLTDVFVRNLIDGTTHLVSVATNGVSGNGPSSSPVVSADGRFVSFVSHASNLVPGDTNQTTDVFLRDRVRGETLLISVARDGTSSGSGPSDAPVMTPDGHYLGFQSWATNLSANDINGFPDLFLRHVPSSTTVQISDPSSQPEIARGSSGASYSLALSPDGSRAIFLSDALNLAPAPRRNTTPLYLRDLPAGDIRRIDIFPKTSFSNSWTTIGPPSLSSNGQWLAMYMSWRSDLVKPGIYRAHVGAASDTVELVAPTLTNSTAFSPSLFFNRQLLSEDGQTVILEVRSDILNLPGSTTVHAWSPGSPPVLLSTNIAITDFLGRRHSYGKLLAANPSTEFVAYSGYQPSTVEPTLGGPLNLWVVHRPTLETRCLTRAEYSDDFPHPSLSANGRRIAFVSSDPQLVPGDLNNAPDVYLYDWDSQQLELVSVRSTSLPSDTASFPSIGALYGLSADGTRLAYTSATPHGSAPDSNEAADIFVRDLTTGTTLLASAQAGASGAGNGVSSEPSFSADGRWVAFLSTSTNLAGPPGNGAQNVFLRDLAGSNTWLVSRSALTGLASPRDCSLPAISPDGRHVAFVSSVALLKEDTAPPRDVYLFDRVSETLQLVTSNVVSGAAVAGNRHSGNPRWSPDSRWLAFESHHSALVSPPVATTTPRWHIRDMTTGRTLRLHQDGSRIPSSEARLGAVFSGDSSTVAFTYAINVAASVSSVEIRSLIDPSVSHSVPRAQRPRLDQTGRRLAYRVAANSGLLNALSIEVLDRETGAKSTVDVALDSTRPSATTRDYEIDPDGRFVFFTSAATNLHLAARTGYTQLFARDLVAGTTLLLSANSEGKAANSAIGNLVLAGDGRTLAFTTFASNLAPTDLNQTADVYLVRLHANAEGEIPVLSIHRANPGASEVTILWSSTPGVRYRAEYKNALNDTIWTPLAPAEVASGTQSTVQDRNLPESRPHRFYRVVRE